MNNSMFGKIVGNLRLRVNVDRYINWKNYDTIYSLWMPMLARALESRVGVVSSSYRYLANG